MAERKKSGKPKVGEIRIGRMGDVQGDQVFGDKIDQRRQSVVDTGGGAYIGGNVSLGGGTFIVRDKVNISHRRWLDEEKVVELVAGIYQKVNTSVDDFMQEPVTQQVQQIETIVTADKPEAKKQAELELFAMRLAKMAPDILEVVLKTLANPVLGLGTVAEKIRQKAQQGG